MNKKNTNNHREMTNSNSTDEIYGVAQCKEQRSNIALANTFVTAKRLQALNVKTQGYGKKPQTD